MFRLPAFKFLSLLVPVFVAVLPTILFGSAGDLYVLEGNSSSSNYSIVRLAADGTKSQFATDINGPGPIEFDREGNLFVGNVITGEVLKFSPDGTRSLVVSQQVVPAGLAFDAAGNLYVANAGRGRVTDPNPSDGVIIKIAPDGNQSVFASDLNLPASLAFDNQGNLFVLDTLYGAILKISPEGTRTTFATALNEPAVIAFDSSGILYATEKGSGSLLKFDRAGLKTTVAAGLTSPAALALDQTGRIFVADAYHRIHRIEADGDTHLFASDVRPSGMAFEPARGHALNLSTRGSVLRGNGLLISGFIVAGDQPKRILIRGIGPSLAAHGVQGVLLDPALELRDSSGNLMASNNDWKVSAGTGTSQQAAVEMTTLPPSDDREPAILVTLAANSSSYTALLRGFADTVGVGLIEVYDLDRSGDSILANVSGRGLVEAQAPLISGFILGGNGATVLVRAIGPSLDGTGISVLDDPRVDLYDSNGSLVAANDDWRASQAESIERLGLAPRNDAEAAILETLAAGNYTAVVTGKNAGVGLVEVYQVP